MSTIHEEIREIVRKTREEREKTAQNEETGFSSGEETSTISKGSSVAEGLKKASQQIQQNTSSVDLQSVVNFAREML